MSEKESKFINLVEETTNFVSENKEAVQDGLSSVLQKHTDLSEEESRKVVKDVSSTIELIQDNYEDLQKAKAAGKTRAEWFKDKLDETIEQYKPENPDDFVSGIKNGLATANKELGAELFGKEINLSEPLKSTKFEDLNKTAVVNNLQEEIKNNTLLGALVFEDGGVKIDENHKEIKAVKDYFETKLDSPTDKTFKKAVSTATVIAQKNDLLPGTFKDKTPAEIAMVVDRGVTAAKLAYKLGKGEMAPIDVVEYTIDRNTAALNSAIVTTCTKVGGAVGEKVGAFIGSVFGPAGTVVGGAIGKVVGKVAGYLVGKFITEGMKKAANAVKSFASKAWEVVKSAASALNPFNWF